MKNIPEIDLSRMLELPKCAVICRNIEELEIFYANATQQLGEYLYWDFDDALGLWNNYEDKTGFTLFAGSDSPSSMSYCNEEWFRGNGYEIIELSDIAYIPDIRESEATLDTLFS